MSLVALKLTENNHLKLPVYCAAVVGGMHLLLAVRMSLLRIGHRLRKDDGKLDENFYSSDKFKVASRVQLNHSEYSSVFVALLLYLQTRAEKTQNLTHLARAACLITTVGCVAFNVGFARVENLNKTNKLKMFGAITRYVGFGTLILSVLQTGCQ